jgi:hypothetical protein
MITEGKQTSTTTASIGQDETDRVEDNAEAHAAGAEANDGIEMSGEMNHEVIASFAAAFGRFGLVVGDFVESRQDSAIDGLTMTKKSANDTLHAGGAFFIEQGVGVGSCMLCFLTIDRLGPEMRSIMLSKFGRRTLTL